MATNIHDIKTDIMENFKNQRLPINYYDSDYLRLAIMGCKRFYRDTGKTDFWETEFDTDTLTRDLDLLEYDYCVISAEIEFLKSVRANWNTMVSYTTNALSITNAFKPFEFLKQTIQEKQIELVELFHKMIEASNMTPITDLSVDTNLLNT